MGSRVAICCPARLWCGRRWRGASFWKMKLCRWYRIRQNRHTTDAIAGCSVEQPEPRCVCKRCGPEWQRVVAAAGALVADERREE